MAWTTPAPAPAGAPLTATFWDVQVKGNMDAIGGAWTAFSPTISGWTLGNGTVAAAYRLTGKTLEFRIKVTAGSTTATTSNLGISGLPAVIHGDWASNERWVARDISAGTSYFGDADVYGGTASFNCRSVTPFAWATGDFIGISAQYETA